MTNEGKQTIYYEACSCQFPKCNRNKDNRGLINGLYEKHINGTPYTVSHKLCSTN